MSAKTDPAVSTDSVKTIKITVIVVTIIEPQPNSSNIRELTIIDVIFCQHF